MVTLYYGPGACSMAPHITLYEIGKPFEAKPVALRKGQQRSPEYLQLNPKGKVPVIQDGGKTITENVAILTHLAKSNPDAKLWPASDVEMLTMMSWAASGLHPLFGRIFRPSAFSDAPGSEDAVKKLAVDAVKQNFALTDKMLAGKEWAMGSYSVADPYLFVFFRWATNLKVDTAGAPNYAAHQERMLKRPAVQKMLDAEKAAQAELDKAA
jgi:glutathione S-transferase